MATKAVTSKKTTAKKSTAKKTKGKAAVKEVGVEALSYLPRPTELRVSKSDPSKTLIFGVDEAGRGPLAGPVVAAACYLPSNIPGITDSKKITDEEERERLYELIIKAKGVRWAAAIVDAQKIDEINILQATMLAMSMASEAVITPLSAKVNKPASSEREGCYVVGGYNPPTMAVQKSDSYGLIDGNRCPTGERVAVEMRSRLYCVEAEEEAEDTEQGRQ